MGSERPLVLISSGAYAEQELTAEFGLLPPAFLPLGLGRLFELQLPLFKELNAEVVMTLPESFEVSSWDADRLALLRVTVVRTADDLSLGAAVLRTLGYLGFEHRPLRLLHGDTMVWGVDPGVDDILAVADGGDGYRWAYATLREGGLVDGVTAGEEVRSQSLEPRLCGYFAFNSVARYAEALALAGGNFLGSINNFSRTCALRAVRATRWLDFGHVQTFFRSRRILTTERAFNSLEITPTAVRKRSSDATVKLQAEARWLREAPSVLAPYCARVLGEDTDECGYFYETEYEYMPTLAELYVFGRLPFESWQRILSSCNEFIAATVAAAPLQVAEDYFAALVIAKTRARLEKFTLSAGLDLDASNTLNGKPAPSLNACVAGIEQAIKGTRTRPSVMHGDFCFSNILYNFRTGRIRVIDPRGLDEQGAYRPLGDCRYDLAKLMHSICGRYDMIMADRYSGRRTGDQEFELTFRISPWRSKFEQQARENVMGGIPLGSVEVWVGMASLFLSMPLLHFDRPDRQAAFIANALRLYMDMEQHL